VCEKEARVTARYVPDDLKAVEKDRTGRKLVVYGVIAFGAGVIGTVLATILKVVWLGILGGPIGGLSWLAMVAGAACAIGGFLMVKAAREARGRP
jgi:hypothetical protein